MADHVQSPGISQLIRRAREGDESAKSDLVANYRSYLVLMAQRAIGNQLQRRVDASDIAQQTCTEAWRDLDGFLGETEPEFSAWIRQILRRNMANVVRDQRAAKRDMTREFQPDPDDSATLMWLDPAAMDASPSQLVMKGEMALNLADVLERLPDGQREAVRMRHLEGLPLAEIAERLGKSTVATAGLIKRGLQALRKAMPETDW